MDAAPLVTVAGLLLVKEIGVPIPIPGDILVLGAGAATSGRPEALVWLMAILAAGYIGGTIQFLMVRGAMRGPLLALLTRLGVPQTRLESLAATLRKGGPRAIALARATPGLRVGVIAASGVADLSLRTFLVGFLVGNSVFVGGHFALGFVLGKPALGIASELGNPVVLVAILVALSAAGGAAWVLIRRRSSAAAAASGGTSSSTPRHEAHGDPETGFLAWVDAACPICVALAAASVVRPA